MTETAHKAATVLDHGYIRLVEDWGRGDAGCAEAGIVEAARQSTQGSFRGWVEDEKLLRTLFCNKPQHATPFEFAGMVVEIQAPIFVFREWHRHRTQSYNEMSARYAPLPDLNYIPTVERLMNAAKAAVTGGRVNKQASAIKEAAPLTEAVAMQYQDKLRLEYVQDQRMYEWALMAGIPKECARIHLPVGRYSRMRASANLRNWLAFMTLRWDPAAQWEIRQYASEMALILEARFPRTWALYVEGRG